MGRTLFEHAALSVGEVARPGERRLHVHVAGAVDGRIGSCELSPSEAIPLYEALGVWLRRRQDHVPPEKRQPHTVAALEDMLSDRCLALQIHPCHEGWHVLIYAPEDASVYASGTADELHDAVALAFSEWDGVQREGA